MSLAGALVLQAIASTTGKMPVHPEYQLRFLRQGASCSQSPAMIEP